MRYAPNPYDGGGVNLNPRPIGRNPQPRHISAERKGGTAKPERTTRNRRAIGETCKATAEGRTRLLYG